MSIVSVIWWSYLSVFKNFIYILKISWAWFLFIVLIPFLSVLFNGGTVIFIFLSVFFFYFALMPSIAVAWHQKIIHPETSQHWFYMRYNGRVFFYFLKSFLLFLIAALPFLIVTQFNEFMPDEFTSSNSFFILNDYLEYFLFAIFILFFLVIFARFCLILPATAVGNHQLSIRKALQYTKGNSLKIMVIVFFAFLPIFLLPEMIDGIKQYIFRIQLASEDDSSLEAIVIKKIITNDMGFMSRFGLWLTFLTNYMMDFFIALLTELILLSSLSYMYLEITKGQSPEEESSGVIQVP